MPGRKHFKEPSHEPPSEVTVSALNPMRKRGGVIYGMTPEGLAKEVHQLYCPLRFRVRQTDEHRADDLVLAKVILGNIEHSDSEIQPSPIGEFVIAEGDHGAIGRARQEAEILQANADAFYKGGKYHRRVVELLRMLDAAVEVQRRPCNHAGIGKPGCITCDPAIRDALGVGYGNLQS